MHHKERLYAARRKQIRDVCQKYDDPQRWTAKSHKGDQFWFYMNHSLAACIHAKVRWMNMDKKGNFDLFIFCVMRGPVKKSYGCSLYI